MTRALPVLAALVLSACPVVEIPVVSKLPDGGDQMIGAPCATSAACMAGQYCQKDSCGAATGNCAQRPSACPSDGPPECGCDGVTYWNSCLREAAGVEAAVAEPGPCRQPRPCDSTTPCPGDAYCARLVFPNECGRIPAGACWVVPDGACAGPQHTYNPCNNLSVCLDQCAAIRAEQPMAERPRMAGPCP
ncbi:MAG: hypothetical protein U0228_21295 [Myxococcaceae bacterium]